MLGMGMSFCHGGPPLLTLSVGFSSDGYLSASSGIRPATSAWTVMAWVYVDSVADAWSRIFTLSDGADTVSVEVDQSTGYPNIVVNGTPNAPTTAAATIVGAWRHIALIHNGSGVYSLFVCGNLVRTTGTLAVVAPTITALTLGSDDDGTDGFTGKFYAARVWDAALTQAEINAEMATLSAVKTASLVSDTLLNGTSGVEGWTDSGAATTEADSPVIPEDPVGYPSPGVIVDSRAFQCTGSLIAATATHYENDENGQPAATRTREDSSTAAHGIGIGVSVGVTSGKQYFADLVVKADGRDWLLFQVSGGGNNANGIVNPATNSVGNTAGSPAFVFTDLRNDWWNVRMTFTAAATGTVGATVYHATSGTVFTGIVGDVTKGLLISRFTLSRNS